MCDVSDDGEPDFESHPAIKPVTSSLIALVTRSGRHVKAPDNSQPTGEEFDGLPLSVSTTTLAEGEMDKSSTWVGPTVMIDNQPSSPGDLVLPSTLPVYPVTLEDDSLVYSTIGPATI